MGISQWLSLGWLYLDKSGNYKAYCENCGEWCKVNSVGCGEYQEMVCFKCGDVVLDE